MHSGAAQALLQARSPLEAPGVCALAGVEMRERRDLAKLRLRVKAGGASAFAEALGQAAGSAPPLVPNQVSGDQHLSIGWTAPGAWLALGERVACDALAEAAGRVAAGAALVTPVTSGLVAIEVTGPRAAALLATGCPLDLEGSAVGERGCASSLFDQTPIFLQRLPGSSGYTLVVERPLAWSLWAALADNVRMLGGGA
ncbi:MAG TPA: sarcosine oxidase subunit gamma family protein [Caulobacteraceae bacterium]|jgi:sarcosine oxidase subunit gamma